MVESLPGRRVLVVGIGRSGVAAGELLIRQGASVVANDARERDSLDAKALSLETSGAKLVLGSHPKEVVHGCDLVVISPGVHLDIPIVLEAQRLGIPVWSELELAFRALEGTVVAVTGTKGKSTTATMIADALRVAGRDVRLAGNIGVPLSSAVAGSSANTVFVVEVSSFQLETIERFRPHVALLLDVSPDHLDWHPSFDAYVGAKTRLFMNQEVTDWAVVYGGNPLTVDMASKGRARRLFFDLDCLGDLYPHLHRDGPWIVRHENGRTEALARIDELQVPGRHNRLNAMAASAAACLLGVSGEDVTSALERFRGLPHALEKVAEIDGVRFYNDSKATNIEAVRAALESFEGNVYLILGGRFKGGDFRDLREPVRKRVKCVLAIGESRSMVAEALGDTATVIDCKDLETAVSEAHRRARRDAVVLLSPAGSSFDMFTDYRERGEKFRQAVRRLRRRKVNGERGG
jgi:UDP-N-acetylmuramoylalanine--D-glutamate ligase